MLRCVWQVWALYDPDGLSSFVPPFFLFPPLLWGLDPELPVGFALRCVWQVWALYDPDELPRYYAKVTKVSRKPSFRCNVTWLEPKKPGHIPRHEGARDMEDMVQPATGCLYLSTLKELQTSASCFSHLVDPGPKSFPIMILPQPGEVWALFVPKFGVPPHKDREEEGDFEPLRKDVGRGERELVYALAMVDREVHEGTLRVVYLRKVAGYNSVYEVRPPLAIALEAGK